MPTSYTVILDATHSQQIRTLARENDVTEPEVIRQLVDIGLAEIDEQKRVPE